MPSFLEDIRYSDSACFYSTPMVIWKLCYFVQSDPRIYHVELKSKSHSLFIT